MSAWAAVDVFGNRNAHLGSCCSCCNGYCPLTDTDDKPGTALLVHVGDYVLDHRIAIRHDLIDTSESDFMPAYVPLPEHLPEHWSIPEQEPPESTATFTASIAARLLALDIDIRDGSRGVKKEQHLYIDGEHIGWIMPALSGLTLAEVRAHAKAAETITDRLTSEGTESAAAMIVSDLAFEPIDALRQILRAADEIRAEIEAAS